MMKSKKIKFVALFMVVLLLTMSVVISAYADAPNFQYELAYEDHFTGTSLNLNDWYYRTGERYGGFNRAENVRVADSNLYIDFKYEDFVGDGVMRYTAGGIISRNNFGYGYYEVRAKLYGATKGLHQSFWTMGTAYSPDVTAGLVPRLNQNIEIDGFEADSITPDHVDTNAHYYIPTHSYVGGKAHSMDITQWFTMGYEWLPDKVNFYLNDQIVRSVKLDQYYAPQNFWLSALATPDNHGGAEPPLAGAAMQVDYFRFYSKRNTSNIIGNGGFEYNSTTKNLQYPLNWIETGDEAASLVVQNEGRTGDYALKHTSTSNYNVTTKQMQKFLPNSKYKLSAWVKSSGGQSDCKMTVAGYGGVDRSINIPQSSTWQKVEINDIYVTNQNATISFVSNASANQWLLVDDVILEDVTEQCGNTLIYNVSDSAYSESGTWYNSSLTGYLGNVSRYSNVLGSYAQWNPQVQYAGDYDAYIYKIVHSTNDTNAKIDVVYNGGTDTQYFNYTQGVSGWVYLGRYNFNTGTNGYIRNTLNTSKNARADSIMLVPSLLYYDDFERGNMSLWTTSGGTWSVTDDGSKVLRQSNATASGLAFVGEASWDNYSVSAKLKPTSAGGFPGLIGRYQNLQNLYTFRLNRNTNKAELLKAVNGSWTSLGSANYTADINVWQTLKMEMNGDSIKCSINGAEVISVTDASLTSGYAGVRAVSASASYDDFRVYR